MAATKQYSPATLTGFRYLITYFGLWTGAYRRALLEGEYIFEELLSEQKKFKLSKLFNEWGNTALSSSKKTPSVRHLFTNRNVFSPT